MPKISAQFARKPKTIFLVDGLGAFVTSSLLFLVLMKFQEYFGMPSEVLSLLSVIAFIFSIYSILCFLFLKENWGLFLKVIMVANLLYCFLSIGIVIYYYSVLTAFGLTYFLVEIAVVVGLVLIESQTLTRVNQRKGDS
jgi:hypothetical protein